ncbi:MAG: hypothetical protein WB587_06010 [Nitrososphaeraceae archaeon]
MRELPYEERVELCEKMLNDHRPWTEISKKTGFGPNKISEIKKEMHGIDGSPKHTQANAMFYDRKSNYEVAQALGLTEEQTTNLKKAYLRLILHDKLESLYNLGDTKIQSILELQAALSSNGISEQEYIGIIPEVGRKKKLQIEINVLDGKIAESKSSLYYYQSEIDKSKQMKAHLDAIEDQKTIEIREHELMDIQLLRKYGRFKESIEKALRGYIDQLLSEVIAERRAYDREQLTEFLKSIARAIMEGIKCDIAVTTRVATSIVHSLKDQELIIARVLQEAQGDIEDWLDSTDKQRSVPSIGSSLNI